jgi:hypothetical protein
VITSTIFRPVLRKRLRTVLETKTPGYTPDRFLPSASAFMKYKTKLAIPPLAKNGKSPVALCFHRNGTVSFKDGEGRWVRYLAEVPPSIIVQLDRVTKARLWYRNFKVERAWAQAHA